MNVKHGLKEKNMASFSIFTTYLRKMKGEEKKKERINFLDSFISLIGGLIAIILISTAALFLENPIVLAPLGASCVIVFFMHKGPLSQPRHVVGGHFLCTLLGLTIWSLLGTTILSYAVVIGAVLIVMILTDTFHPPSAASALVAVNFHPGWGMLLSVTLCAILLVCTSAFYNNLFRERQYPKYWI
ncbi:HPP family protein [Bacillus massiliigorillae]|uniref:HPP family protein n=1 Tax=Bacillus massiliigorillae TaxID=1243664 RepID=UPI0003A75EB4|nr:HPP family protein [Bacillus massiliigorillae]